MSSPRHALRAFAVGQGSGALAIPLALHTSARIQERDAEGFVYDATQLANALRDLIDAISPDGVPVTAPQVLLADCVNISQLLGSSQLDTALEATRRLRSSQGDRVIVAAVLPGPSLIADRLGVDAAGASDAVLTLGREFLGAGVDVLIISDENELAGTTLSTLGNVARFHQAVALCHPTARYGLSAATVADLYSPVAGVGVTVTDRMLERDTDLGVLGDWVNTVRG